MSTPQAPETEDEVMRRSVAMLADRLPADWSVEVSFEETGSRVDALIELSDPDGKTAMLLVEAKRVVEGRDVDPIRHRLEAVAKSYPWGQGLVAARYLSPPVRAKLADAGLSFIDATGNIRIALQSPALYISDRGADRDPWRGPGRPRGTLKGAPAAKVVRLLADRRGPWTVTGLIKAAKVSTGATYRVVEYLESEALAIRDESGRLTVPDWAELLRRWSADFGFVRNSQITRWIAPRGLPDLVSRIASDSDSPQYAITGTLAAAEWAEYAPARVAMIYVANAAQAGRRWDLRATDTGANVMLAEPEFAVVFERTRKSDKKLTLAAPSQVFVDLATGPGRNPNEAEELLNWMRENEQSWRR